MDITDIIKPKQPTAKGSQAVNNVLKGIASAVTKTGSQLAKENAAKNQLAEVAKLKAQSAATPKVSNADFAKAVAQLSKPTAVPKPTPLTPPSVTSKVSNTSSSSTLPSDFVSSNGLMVNSGNSTDANSSDATGGISDNAPTIEDVYAPVINSLHQQATFLQDRYGQNKSDISSIFGILSTVRSADIPKIQQQYATSIQQQQADLAAQTGTARAAQAQGEAGAATAGAELGSDGMPAPTSSASGVATDAAVKDSTAYGDTWKALQNVMSMQQQENVRSAQFGYNAMEANALTQLRRTLEDNLNTLHMKEADVQSQIAQGKLSVAQAQAQMANENTIAKNKLQNALDVAGISAGARVDAAKIAKSAKLGAAGISAASRAANQNTKPKTYSNDVGGWVQKMKDANASKSQISSLMGQAQKAYAAAQSANTGKTPTPGQIYAQWNKIYGNQTFAVPMQEYISKYLPR
jgi:hypothetical protein